MPAHARLYRTAVICILLCLVGVETSLSAGTGILRGRVVDEASKDALPGAVVRVQGTGVGMATDLDGKFDLRNVPVGKQTVAVSYVGYKKISVEVTVSEDMVLDRDISLTAEAIEGETVVVTDRRRGSCRPSTSSCHPTASSTLSRRRR